MEITNTLRLSSDVSRIIWGYVFKSLERDDVPYPEVAFAYSMYHFAVLDILREAGIEEEVREIFTPSFALFTNNADNGPLLGALQGIVNSMLSWMDEDGLKYNTIEDAKKIFSLKAFVPGNNDIETKLYGYKATEYECKYYVNSIKFLRIEISSAISGHAKINSSESYQKPAVKRSKNKTIYNTPATIILCIAIVVLLYLLFRFS